jgi:branched-chain amino acid transport system permease protein
MTSVLTPPAVNDPRVPWTPSPQGRIARLVVFGLLLALMFALPLVVPDPQINLVTRAFTFGIIALSMNMLTGYTGTVSLGHQAFVGLGAFTAAYILSTAGMPWLVAVAGAAILGAVQALAIGVLSLRVQGFFFAIVTLAYGLFTQDVLFNIDTITGGGGGSFADRPQFTVPGDDYIGIFNKDVRYAWVALLFLAAVWIFDWRFTSSKGGRAVKALRDDPRVAASWGINVRAYTMLAFALSGAMAGIAGALLASTQSFVSPQSFTLGTALTYVLMTTVGGVGSRPGVVAGGFVFAGLGPVLTAMHDTVGWGKGADAIGDTALVEVCSTGISRTFAVILGLVVIGAGIEALRHLTLHGSRAVWQRGTGGLVFLGAGYLGLKIVLGTFGSFGGYCVFTTISPLLEPLIGVSLLLITLIQYPGGIAQQLEAPLRWLSHGKFHAEQAASAGGSAAGSSSQRP